MHKQPIFGGEVQSFRENIIESLINHDIIDL